MAAAAFFDDLVRLASHSSEDSDGEFLNAVLRGLGAKSVPLGQSRVWSGVKTSLGQCTAEGFYEQTPTESAVQAVIEGCSKAVAAGSLGKTEAASLRGKANWAHSHSVGAVRAHRYGSTAEKARK